MWLGRLLLEQRYYESVFVTFTYDDASCPVDDNGRLVLVRKDFTDMLKRARKRANTGFRYFGVGEYGSKTGRPHFHLLAFASPGSHWPYYDQFWQAVWSPDGRPLGFTTLSLAEISRLRYCLGYTAEKLLKEVPQSDGRPPEFSSKSLRPPLGYRGMQEILGTVSSRLGGHKLALDQDVPTEYRLNAGRYPIGSYWRSWLRKQLGVDRGTQEDWTKPDDWDIELEKAEVRELAARKRLRDRASRRAI